MLENKIRKRTEGLMNKLGSVLSKTGISPNFFTLLAPVFAGITLYFIINHNILLALIFLILTSVYDAIDGAVARASKKVTKFGNYLDAVMDRYVEIIIYFGFLLSGYVIESFLAASFSFIVSYNKARSAIVTQISNRGWPSLGERLERLLILIIGLFVAVFWPSLFGYDAVSVTLYLIAFVSFIGGLQRIFYVKKLLS